MDEVKTGVDELIELLKHEARISLPDAAKRLRQPEAIVQNWVDFLVEEKILGTEYKFTTPYIYLNAPAKANAITATAETIIDLRTAFIARARAKGIPDDKLRVLWENHLRDAIDARSDFFHRECAKLGLAEPEDLLHRYIERVLKEYSLIL